MCLNAISDLACNIKELITFVKCFIGHASNAFRQGTLTVMEGSVRLTSSLKQHIL